MTESVQRILKRWASEGHHPQTADDIIAYAVATAEGWNQQPTPLVWGGKGAISGSANVLSTMGRRLWRLCAAAPAPSTTSRATTTATDLLTTNGRQSHDWR